MKPWITLLSLIFIFSSCTKEQLSKSTEPQSLAASAKSTQQGSYVSDWSTYSGWTKTDAAGYSIFSVKTEVPQITQDVVDNGLVLIYAKVNTNDPDYQRFTMPVMLPFYFLPPSERPMPETFYFFDTTMPGLIKISYKVNFTKEENPPTGGGTSLGDFQFQYVVFTPQFLSDRGLDKTKVRNYYTYDQVMVLANQ